MTHARLWRGYWLVLATVSVVSPWTIASHRDEASRPAIGVTYSPDHLAEYPYLGGWVEVSKLREAIDADFRFLSKYFTHVRTDRASYYGCKMAPVAAKYGIKLYLGVKRYLSPQSRRQELHTVAEAIKQYPETIEAVIVGDNDLSDQEQTTVFHATRFSFIVHRAVDIMRQVDEVKRQVGTTSVQFGTLDNFLWLEGINRPVVDVDGNSTDPTPYRDAIMKELGKLDLIGVRLQSRLVEKRDQEWEALYPLLPKGTTVFIESSFDMCDHQYRLPGGPILSDTSYNEMCINKSRRQYEASLKWTPPKSKPALFLISAAFDALPDSSGRKGYFTSSRRRKYGGYPRPLNDGDDPADFPTAPANTSCPMGMYHLTLWEIQPLVKLCVSGHSFRNPTKFDEMSIKSACENPFCHAVVAELRRIPKPPRCPFDELMTEEMMNEWILKPFDLYCGRKTVVVEKGNFNPVVCCYSPGMAANAHFLTAKFDNKEPHHCDAAYKFLGTNASNPDPKPVALPLTQEALEQMCFQPECESMMLQMAHPHSTTKCEGHGYMYEEQVISNIVVPYYDGCYEPSLFAVEYYDTTYRKRKAHPRLPDSSPTPSPTTRKPPLPSTSPSPNGVDSLSSSGSSTDDAPDDEEMPIAHKTLRVRKKTAKPRTPVSPNVSSSCEDTELNLSLSSNHKHNVYGGPTEDRQHSSFPESSSLTTFINDTISGPEPTVRSRNLTKHNRLYTAAFAVSGVAAFLGFVVCVCGYKLHLANANQANTTNYVSISPRRTDGIRTDVNENGAAATVSTVEQGPHSMLSDAVLSSLFIPPHDIREIRLIGSGGQALVYLVEYQRHGDSNRARLNENTLPTKMLLASKQLSKSDTLCDPQAIINFVSEIKLIASLKHPNIVQLVGTTWTTGHDIHALFEYMPDGDLYSHLNSTPWYEWNATKLQMAIDVIEALTYVHSLDPPLVHRDIKSRNVLLRKTLTSENNEQEALCGFHAKLTDFGVARRHSTHQTMTTGVGTSRWLAPEVILGGGDYDQSCDIYSFGVLLSELDTHELPFMDRLSPTGDTLPMFVIMEQVASEGIRPRFRDECPSALLALAHECLSYNPQDRPRADEVLRRLLQLDAELRLPA